MPNDGHWGQAIPTIPGKSYALEIEPALIEIA